MTGVGSVSMTVSKSEYYENSYFGDIYIDGARKDISITDRPQAPGAFRVCIDRKYAGEAHWFQDDGWNFLKLKLNHQGRELSFNARQRGMNRYKA